MAREHDDPALACFALVLEGMAAVRRGRTVEGFAALDEAMLPVLAGRVERALGGRHLLHDDPPLRRARRPRADAAVDRVPRPVVDPAVPDVHVRPRHPGARAAGDQRRGPLGPGRGGARTGSGTAWSGPTAGCPGWRRTSSARSGGCAATRPARGRRTSGARAFGIDPQPGEALLQWAEGDAAGALAALRVSLAGQGRLARARLLLAAVELALATGDRGAAGALAAELVETADVLRHLRPAGPGGPGPRRARPGRRPAG